MQCWAHDIIKGIDPKAFVPTLWKIGLGPQDRLLANDWQKRAEVLADTWSKRGYDHHGKVKGKITSRRWNMPGASQTGPETMETSERDSEAPLVGG